MKTIIKRIVHPAFIVILLSAALSSCVKANEEDKDKNEFLAQAVKFFWKKKPDNKAKELPDKKDVKGMRKLLKPIVKSVLNGDFEVGYKHLAKFNIEKAKKGTLKDYVKKFDIHNKIFGQYSDSRSELLEVLSLLTTIFGKELLEEEYKQGKSDASKDHSGGKGDSSDKGDSEGKKIVSWSGAGVGALVFVLGGVSGYLGSQYLSQKKDDTNKRPMRA